MINDLHNQELVGYPNEEHTYRVFYLELRKRKIMINKEAEWRLKSRVIWIEKGDDNTKLFHQYAIHRRMLIPHGI
jgi:hypothetical protein